MPGGGDDTALASNGEGSGRVFDTKGNLNGISQRWKKWKRSFGLYLTGKGVMDNKQKRALLLHVASVDVQDFILCWSAKKKVLLLQRR